MRRPSPGRRGAHGDAARRCRTTCARPLASIKAMVSGLREPDVEWSPQQVSDALATVEAETDRLNRLVGNLLDASRLQTGELPIDVRTDTAHRSGGGRGCAPSDAR